MSGKLQKVAYKPVGLLLGVAAGAIAGAVFKEVWKLAVGEDDAPTPDDEERGWGEVLAAAAISGAIFSVVRAAVQRGGAVGVRKVTGSWPD
ncbi:DUF4235 domain-containing protein [Winogradskya consettensis]|uniref:Membrane protein n=2 Tax=Winogradskya TaxID=3240235 RepID=A0A919S7N8_9ACTN|nr:MULTISPECIES: DUF4235 domain-containing protein [Actinoplanes]GIE20657.1 membrane protein [Actinoplanes humidus]GIM66165.1 membrane protein [Actinoplanes consettensis]